LLLRALLLFLFFTFLARAAWRLLEGVARGAMGGPQDAGRRPGGGPAPTPVKMAQCPVCGTYVVPGKAPSSVSRGQVVYFCSEACRSKYAA
jgi:YHS domain-containing protein